MPLSRVAEEERRIAGIHRDIPPEATAGDNSTKDLNDIINNLLVSTGGALTDGQITNQVTPERAAIWLACRFILLSDLKPKK